MFTYEFYRCVICILCAGRRNPGSVNRQQQLLQEAMWLNGGRMEGGRDSNGLSNGSGEIDGDPSGERWPEQQQADSRYEYPNGYSGDELASRGGGMETLDGVPPSFQGGGLTLSPSAPSLSPFAPAETSPALGARRKCAWPLTASGGGPPMENGRPKTGHRRKQRPWSIEWQM